MRTLTRIGSFRQRLLGPVSTLAAGSVGGQLVVLGLSPILTRLYGPDDFGLLGIFAAALALLSVLATLRYELALPVADDAEVDGLLVLGLVAVAVTAMATLLLMPAVATGLLDSLNAVELRRHVSLLAIGVGSAGLLQVLTYLRIRHRQYGQLAASRFSQAVATTLSQIGLAGAGPGGLLLGYVGGRLFGAALLIRGGRPRSVAVADVARTGVRYRRFPLITLWATLVNALGLQLPNLILAAAFGPTVVGLFALTIRVIQAPMAMLGQAVTQVFLGGLAEARKTHRIHSHSQSTFTTLCLVALAPAGIAMLGAPDVFEVVFGRAWRPAGEMAVFLIPWIALAFVGQPLTSLAFTLGGQPIDFGFQVALAVGRVGALILGAAISTDQMLGIQAFGAVSAIVWTCYILWLLRLGGVSGSYAVWRLAHGIGAALLVAMPIGVARLIDAGTTGMLVASLASLIALVLILGRGLRRTPHSDASGRRGGAAPSAGNPTAPPNRT